MYRFRSCGTSVIAALLLCTSISYAGFSTVEPGPSIVVIKASSPNEVVRDCVDMECSSGPLAKAIVEALKTSDVTIAELFDRINRSTASATYRLQLPSIVASAPISVPLRKAGGRSAALIIGNGAYMHLPHLVGAPRDANAVGGALQGTGVETKTLVNSAFSTIGEALETITRGLGEDDTIIVYYAGHGFSLGNVDYLPGLETQFSGDEGATLRSSIALSELLERVARSRAGRKVIILDTHFPKQGDLLQDVVSGR